MRKISRNPRGMQSTAHTYTWADAMIDAADLNPHMTKTNVRNVAIEAVKDGLRKRTPLHKLIKRAA